MQVKFPVKVGDVTYEITAKVNNLKELFKVAGPFAECIPSKGPNGEEDLKLVYREVKGYTYYSVVSESAGQEFALGEHKEGDTLFKKGWQDLYNGGNSGGSAKKASRPAPKASDYDFEDDDFEEAPKKKKKASKKKSAPVEEEDDDFDF